MPEYNCASDFLIAVQNEIKWKRAKKIATQEIADHISDQCEALRKKGLNEEDAIKQTLCELGSAKTIGERLNSLHRPKTNWLLILSTAAFLSIGLAIEWCLWIRKLFPLRFQWALELLL